MNITAAPSIDNRLRGALLCLLLGMYLLVYVPVPDSADSNALLAVSAALARYGSPDMNSIAHAEWYLAPISRLGAQGLDGALYTKKGPTPSLALLPLVLLADAAPFLTTRATAMLFNPLVTAATALLLYSVARRLGFRPATAFTVGLLYGVATFAVVYVKTLFGEPLAALLLLLALLGWLDYREHGGRRSPLLMGVALGALVGVNTVYALFPAFFGVWLLWYHRADLPTLLRPLALFVLPVLAWLALLALLNGLRFGSPLDSGYHFAEGEGFTRPIPLGIYGLLISPYRGLFWYNPLLLLALPGWWMLRRRESALAWLLLALIGAQIIAFAGWWSWHGGIVWGPRFLLPVTPLIVLLLAPLIEAILTRGVGNERDEQDEQDEWDGQDGQDERDERGAGRTRQASSLQANRRGKGQVRLLRGVVIGFAALSVGVQLLGVLYSYYPYQFYLNVHYGTDVWDAPVTLLRDEVLTQPGLSPIVGHLALAAVGSAFEPAWLANGVDGVGALPALALLAVGFAALLLPRLPRYALPILVMLCPLLTAARAGDPTERARVEALETALTPRGTVVVASTAFDETLVDAERGGRIITLNAPTDPDDPLAGGLWDFARGRGGWLWYVTWFGAGDPLDWMGRDLWASAAFVTERTTVGHRALLFYLDAPALDPQAGGWRFGEALRLDRYAVERLDGGVYIQLEWSAAANIVSADYTWFVHLLDADGNIIAQQDRPPVGGYAPTAGWQPDDRVTDRLFFPVEAARVERLRVGWVGSDGVPLPVTDSDGAALPDPFVLLPP